MQEKYFNCAKIDCAAIGFFHRVISFQSPLICHLSSCVVSLSFFQSAEIEKIESQSSVTETYDRKLSAAFTICALIKVSKMVEGLAINWPAGFHSCPVAYSSLKLSIILTLNAEKSKIISSINSVRRVIGRACAPKESRAKYYVGVR